jgi:hypothetical protein
METDLRYDTYQKALTVGIKSINEVRAEEDLPPVDGGDEPRLQMQYVPLSMANKPPAEGGAAPAPAPAPEESEDDTDEEVSAEYAAEARRRLDAAFAREQVEV